MKICLIISCYKGGFASFVNNISSLLIKNKHNVTILNLDKDEDDFCIDNVDRRVFDIKSNSNYLSHKKPRQISILLRKVIFYFKHKKREDILKNFLFYNQLTAEWIIKYCSTKLDLTEFDCVVSAEEGISNYFLANNVIAKRKVGYVHPDYLLACFDKRIDRKYFKKLDCICAVSGANANSLKKAFPGLKNKIFGIKNPVDTKRIVDKSNEYEITFEREKINIITVCRLDNSSKALDRLLLLSNDLKKHNYDFVWRIIGDGGYKKVMEKFITCNNLNDNVILMGYMNNPLPYIKASDLFVLQSYYEGYPMSVCESLILKTPVLVTNYPAAGEQIINNITGIIADNNYKDIYEKIQSLLVNKQKILKMKSYLIEQRNLSYDDLDPFLRVCGYNE